MATARQAHIHPCVHRPPSCSAFLEPADYLSGDAPALPLHPVTARITTMIRSTPQKAAPEVLDRVVCDIHPKYNRTMDNQNPEAMSISISRNDGLVRLEDADVKAWREIEWYECS